MKKNEKNKMKKELFCPFFFSLSYQWNTSLKKIIKKRVIFVIFLENTYSDLHHTLLQLMPYIGIRSNLYKKCLYFISILLYNLRKMALNKPRRIIVCLDGTWETPQGLINNT